MLQEEERRKRWQEKQKQLQEVKAMIEQADSDG